MGRFLRLIFPNKKKKNHHSGPTAGQPLRPNRTDGPRAQDQPTTHPDTDDDDDPPIPSNSKSAQRAGKIFNSLVPKQIPHSQIKSTQIETATPPHPSFSSSSIAGGRRPSITPHQRPDPRLLNRRGPCRQGPRPPLPARVWLHLGFCEMGIEDYHVIDLVGEGSFGKVYKGRRKYTRQVSLIRTTTLPLPGFGPNLMLVDELDCVPL
jgi:hypothetical protein